MNTNPLDRFPLAVSRDELAGVLKVQGIRMKIIRISGGKEEVIAEGSRKKLNNRLKQLKTSTRGHVACNGNNKRVEYKLVD